LQSAQLILLVADAHAGWQAEDQAILDALPSIARLIIWNKQDLVTRLPKAPVHEACLAISALVGNGLDALKAEIMLQMGMENSACVFSARQRHVEALADTTEKVAEAVHMHHSAAPPELLAQSLREAANALAQITGKIDVEDILGEIFSRFCIGK
jgi:tRNA modification GTPase